MPRYLRSSRTGYPSAQQKVPLHGCLRNLVDGGQYSAVKDGDAVVAIISADFPREKRTVSNKNGIDWNLATLPTGRFFF